MSGSHSRPAGLPGVGSGPYATKWLLIRTFGFLQQEDIVPYGLEEGGPLMTYVVHIHRASLRVMHFWSYF